MDRAIVSHNLVSADHPWFLVQAHLGREPLAQLHLKRQGFESFLPLQTRSRRHGRKIRTFEGAYFPGYFFVTFNPAFDAWSRINSTIGVRRLVCFGDQLARVPDGIVEGLMLRAGADQRLSPVASFQPGDAVEIAAGPFAGQLALVDAMEGPERVRVLLDWMQQQVKVKLDASHVHHAKAA